MNGNRLKRARKARREIQRLKSMENIVSDVGDCFSQDKKKKKNMNKSRGGSGSGGGGGVEGVGLASVSFSSPTASGAAADRQIYRSSSSRSRSAHSSSSSSSNNSSCSDSNSARIRSSMLCASHGSVSLCGRRREMEDAVTVEPGFVVSSSTAEIENENLDQNQIVQYDFFAVYDGHGGSRVAQFCRDRLHRVLAHEMTMMMTSSGGGEEAAAEEEEKMGGNWEKVMNSCFMKMDEEINGSGIEDESGSGSMKTVGSTAVVAVLSREKLVVANCGDSRAVLCRGGVAVPLSSDHKPDRPDEMERVEAAGGRVINWNGYRVLGVLATSRSIGDHYLKPYVISEPEVTVIERTTNDEFLILASDGLWDVMSNETACDIVRKCLDGRTMRRLSANVHGNNAGEAAAVLAELAMARGSKDNISIIIVELNKSNPNF